MLFGPVDAVCTGEGEFAFEELLQGLKDGRDVTSTKNFWFNPTNGNGGQEIVKNHFLPLMTVNRNAMRAQVENGHRGKVSVFTCPECGGALWQVDETGLIRFRCHVGHAYNGESLLAEQTEASYNGASWPRAEDRVEQPEERLRRLPVGRIGQSPSRWPALRRVF